MKTIVVANTKGGTGKTTLAAGLGAYLADMGWRVLMVDADVQPALSSFYEAEYAEGGLVELLTELDWSRTVSRAAPELDLVASNDPEGRLLEWLPRQADGRLRLWAALQRAGDRWDVVIVDTPGTPGPLLEAAMAAADVIVSPVPPEVLSAREFLRGTLEVRGSVARLVEMMGRAAPPVLAMLWRVDRTRDAREVAEQIRGLQGEFDFRLMDVWAPLSKAYKESATRRVPVHRLDARRRGRAPCALEVMEGVAAELLGGRATPAAAAA